MLVAVVVFMVLGFTSSNNRVSGERCLLDGRRYEVGDTWNPTLEPLGTMPCVNCTCLQGGEVQCVSEECPRPDCPEPEHPPGQCCPVCKDLANLPPTDPLKEEVKESEPKPGCEFEGESFEDGEVFPSNKTGLKPTREEQCVMCVCSMGHLLCHLKTCLPVRCKKLITTRDDCCPRCEELYYTDDMDYGDYLDSVLSDPLPKNMTRADCRAMGYKENSSSWHPVVGVFGEMKCITCRCLNGKVDCVRETCPNDTELPCKKPQLVPGECCKSCPPGEAKMGKKNGRKGKKGKKGRKKDKPRKNKKRRKKKKKKRKKKPQPEVPGPTPSAHHQVAPCLPKKTDRFVYWDEKRDALTLAFLEDKELKVEVNRWSIVKGRLTDEVEETVPVDAFHDKYSHLPIIGACNKRRYKKLKRKIRKKMSRCKTKCRKKVVINVVKRLKTKKVTFDANCGGKRG